MPEFRVRWEIDVDADSPREAAQEAFDAMKRENTLAVVFTVQEYKTGGPSMPYLGREETVDLLEGEV